MEDCGCYTVRTDVDTIEIFYCPLHEAAEDMYKALKDLRHKYKVACEMLGFTETHILNYLSPTDKALLKAGEK